MLILNRLRFNLTSEIRLRNKLVYYDCFSHLNFFNNSVRSLFTSKLFILPVVSYKFFSIPLNRLFLNNSTIKTIHSNRKVKNKFKMSFSKQYNEAIEILNSLQSNKSVIENCDLNREKLLKKINTSKAQLEYLGISQEDLKLLNIIHVSGTKGKGSTCAFTESILRKKNFKTGLFTSPHLISVRERIQINGKPIDEDMFTHYFFIIYNKLKQSNEFKDNMPFFFNFLTLMAFYVFKKEKVNASIIEVGIGGEYDSTNIIDNPIVVGVTSLGIDHENLLGNTIKEISWHKSGIFKKNVPVFCSNNQPEGALEVLLERAKIKNCELKICPELQKYELITKKKIVLGIKGNIQSINASLALQLTNYFLKSINSTNQQLFKENYFETHDNTTNHNNQNKILQNNESKKYLFADAFIIKQEILDALQSCNWRGRYEMIKLNNECSFFLDGAHTTESLNLCIKWYKKLIDPEDSNFYNVLVFNCTGNRNFSKLINSLLKEQKFDLVCLTKNLKNVDDKSNKKIDTFYFRNQKEIDDFKYKEKILKELNHQGLIENFDCITNCLNFINLVNEENFKKNIKTNVLVTGSIHLVGGVISIISS